MLSCQHHVRLKRVSKSLSKLGTYYFITFLFAVDAEAVDPKLRAWLEGCGADDATINKVRSIIRQICSS